MWKFDAVRNVQCGYEGMYASEYYTGYRGYHDRIQQIGHDEADPGGFGVSTSPKASYQRAELWRRVTPIRRPWTGARESLCSLSRHVPRPYHWHGCVCVCRNGVAVLDTLARLMPALSDTHFTALLRGIRRSSHMTCRLVPFLRGVATPKQRATESKKPLFGTSCEVIAMLCRSC